MALGREHPVWRALATELLVLAEATGGTNALVVDDTETVKCAAARPSLDWHSESAIRQVFAAAQPTSQSDRSPYFFAVPLHASHAVIVFFDGPFDGDRIVGAVDDQLPEIERLAAALPFDDPDPASGWDSLG